MATLEHDLQALLEILCDIHLSEREIAEGKALPHDEVARELRELIRARARVVE
jgi:hypothetical protein